MKSCGWIKLHRKIIGNWIWDDAEKLKAWLDLLLMVNHEDKEAWVNGKKVMVKAGQTYTSIYKLAERWGWSRNRVYRFLDALEKDEMVLINSSSSVHENGTTNGTSFGTTDGTKNGTTNGTMITLTNWALYQLCDTTDGTSDGTNVGTSDGEKTELKQERIIYITSSSLNNSNELYKDSDVRPSETEELSSSELSDSDSVYRPTEKPKTRFGNEVQQVLDEWNKLSDVGIKPVTRLSAETKRMQSLVARIRQYGVEDVIKAIQRIRRSRFLIGDNHKGWRIDFDWFVRPNNFIKVMDGNYDDKTERSDDIFERLK